MPGIKARSSQATVDERRQSVLRHVVERGETRINDLADLFGVSLMTMHRDLDDLAARHLLQKKRGRAVAFTSLTMETATRFREADNVRAKEAICATAATWIRPGDTLVIDDSTTLYPLAAALAGIERLTVITNSVGIAQRFGAVPNIEVTILGGRYHNEFNSCTGPDVARALTRIRADIALISATAIHQGRLFHPLREYADVKEAMAECAGRALLLADHSKFGKTATYGFGDVTSYQAVITDSATSGDELAAVRDRGVTVEVSEPNRPGS